MAYLPPEWNDDSRMNFMFSAFPDNRDVNPKHWDSKLRFWRNAIVNSCDSSDELLIDVGVLKSRFSRNGVTPLGLGTVLKDMLNRGEIVSTSDFLNSVYGSWGSWVYGMAKRSFWWSVGNVWQDNKLDVSFVLLALVKKKAELLLSCHYQTVKHSITDNIVPAKVLKARLKANNINITEQEMDIIICHLRKEEKVSGHMLDNKEQIFKFADRNERKVSAVSEMDLNILRLKKAEASNQLQISKLQHDIDELRDVAMMLVKQGLRNKAKKILSRKQALSKTLDKKESLLLNSQDIIQRIQDAHSDANVIEAIKAGAQVFKSMSQESGLTIDNVEKIMADVEEVMDDAAEIDRTISEGSKSVAAISGLPEDDMEELEKELEEMLVGEEKGKNAPSISIGGKEPLLVQLPNVPESSPVAPKETEKTLLYS